MQELYYTYFKPVVKKEHMLFAKEIAAMYNIYTSTGKVATTFVSQFLQKVVANQPNVEQLYYITKSGPTKVYPEVIYKPVMENLRSKILLNNMTQVKVNNKNYTIIIKEN